MSVHELMQVESASEDDGLSEHFVVAEGASAKLGARVALVPIALAVCAVVAWKAASPLPLKAAIAETQVAVDIDTQWYFLDHGAGVPIRCGSPGKLQCLTVDGKNCAWGKYSKRRNYQKMNDATGHGAEWGCPGWPPNDGTDPCVALKCPPKTPSEWFFLDHGAGVPVRCGAPGKLACASYNGKDCVWGKYGRKKAFKAVENVHFNRPVEVKCPGWPSKSGKDTCEVLECYEEEKPSGPCAEAVQGMLDARKATPEGSEAGTCNDEQKKCWINYRPAGPGPTIKMKACVPSSECSRTDMFALGRQMTKGKDMFVSVGCIG